jgi:hypothetical protein
MAAAGAWGDTIEAKIDAGFVYIPELYFIAPL